MIVDVNAASYDNNLQEWQAARVTRAVFYHDTTGLAPFPNLYPTATEAGRLTLTYRAGQKFFFAEGDVRRRVWRS